MTNFKNGLGANLKLIRKTRDITQEELSEIIGIHPRQLSKIETGEHFPSCKTLEKLCAILEVTPKELFDFEFLVEETEALMTGTDKATHIQIHKTAKENVYDLRPDKKGKGISQKACTDESMAKAAKTLNKPLFVEYFEEKKTTRIVVFYPDGKEKVIRNTEDVESKQNMIYMMSKLKKIAKDKVAMNYAKLAIDALDDNESLTKLEGAIYGMKVSRGIE